MGLFAPWKIATWLLIQVKFLDYLAQTGPGKQRCCEHYSVSLNQLLVVRLLLALIVIQSQFEYDKAHLTYLVRHDYFAV
jgi:hypothetical protein